MFTDIIYNAFRKTPQVLDYFSLTSDILVYGAVLFFYAFWVLISSKEKKFNWIFFIELTLGLFIAFSLTGWIKTTFPEIRPYSYYFAGSEQAFNSFPSRHTAIVTTLAFIALPSYFELGAGFLIISVLTAVLRWFSLMHWPIDVIAGWFLGMLIAIFINELTKFLLKLRQRK